MASRGWTGGCDPNRRQRKDVNRPARKIIPEEGALRCSVVGDRDKQLGNGEGCCFGEQCDGA